jgi:hypothetical protein
MQVVAPLNGDYTSYPVVPSNMGVVEWVAAKTKYYLRFRINFAVRRPSFLNL